MALLNYLYILALNPAAGVLLSDAAAPAQRIAYFSITCVLYGICIILVCCIVFLNSAVDPRINKMRTSQLTNYCSICKMYVDKTTQHCLVANRCIRGYDHRCRYLNVTIGGRQQPAFFAYIVQNFVFALYLISLSVTQLVQKRSTTLIVIASVNIALQIFPLCYSFYMILYHVTLKRLRLTTYELICQIDALYFAKTISDRERFARKKLPFCSPQSAMRLTWLQYCEKRGTQRAPSRVHTPFKSQEAQSEVDTLETRFTISSGSQSTIHRLAS